MGFLLTRRRAVGGVAPNPMGCPEPLAEMSACRDSERRSGAMFRDMRLCGPGVGAPLGSAGLKECDHGEDAAVVIVGLVQVQLGEDAADVFLDGALGDPEPPRDAGVGASFCH
jgi:hypothetical protein